MTEQEVDGEMRLSLSALRSSRKRDKDEDDDLFASIGSLTMLGSPNKREAKSAEGPAVEPSSSASAKSVKQKIQVSF